MAAWQQARDEESLPVYGFSCDFAKIEPPPAQLLRLLGAVSSQPQRDGRLRERHGGTLPAPGFFAPDNVARTMGEAHSPTDLTHDRSASKRISRDAGPPRLRSANLRRQRDLLID
jgi:hypothetical protein